jgi:hypothetical protein
MKPADMAKAFTNYLNDGTTPKGMKVKSFFGQLDDSEKKIVMNNIVKAFGEYQKEQKAKAELLKQKKSEVSALKKRAKELGLKVIG